MDSTSKLSTWWLPVILIIAAAMRLYHLDFSFSNDELSALSRLRFDNFNELINKGVGEDFHPAFAQVFLYFWSLLFGISEWVTRLPFVIIGVASVYLIYKLGCELFDENTGLLAAASSATLGFFILYSQLARPYSPGLFFTLLAALGWIKIIKGPVSKSAILTAGFATALAMYTHYFSFMTVGIIWLALLPMLNSFNRKAFFVATTLAGLLYLPHINITFIQLSYGGVGSWLGAPHTDFWIEFTQYIFNSSLFLLLFFFALIIAIALYNRKNLQLNKWQLFCATVFISPLIIGYYYSVYVNPVLQYSTLLFCTPFFLILIFSGSARITGYLPISILIGLVLASSFYSTVFDKKYYTQEHFGVFRELTEKMIEWDLQYGSDKITKSANVNGEYYLGYYFERKNQPTHFATYSLNSDSAMSNFRDIINTSQTPYFAFCWSTIGNYPEVFELIRLKYPRLVDFSEHFNSGVYLYSNQESDERIPLFSTGNAIAEKGFCFPNYGGPTLDSLGKPIRYLMASEDEYSLTLDCTAGNIGLKGGEKLVVQTKVQEQITSDLHIVYALNQINGATHWFGNKLHPVYFEPNDSVQNLLLTRTLPLDLHPDDSIKIYLWKNKGPKIWVDDFTVSFFKGAN